MVVGDLELWTIEKPWVPGEHKGGKGFESCVPDGHYNLMPYTRQNGDSVLALMNNSLGVHLWKEDGPGRYAILIHVGNWSDDVVGCIAPGTGRVIANNRVMVTSSKAALTKFHEFLPVDDQHTLSIHNSTGAKD